MKQKFTRECRMDTYDCDCNKLIRLSGMMQAMQETGRLQMETEKPSYDDLLKVGHALMLSRLDLEIYEELYLNDLLTVGSWPAESSKATFLRTYTIEKQGRLAALCSSQWALVDLQTRKILKVEDLDMSNYYMGEYRELFDGKFKIPKDAALEEVDRRKVRYSDLDYNGHMNNTYSLDMLCDTIPEIVAGTHRVKNLRIHYNREAPLGDVLTVFQGKEDDGSYLFKTLKADGQVNIAARIGLIEK